MLRGVRGATTVDVNEPENILQHVVELLTRMVEQNDIKTEDVGAIIFSSTPDISSVFPAQAARKIGWTEVPLFGTQEIDNPDGVPKCARILILWNTDLPQKEIKHIYMRDACRLRQDISG